jgi:hypothetical protein
VACRQLAQLAENQWHQFPGVVVTAQAGVFE